MTALTLQAVKTMYRAAVDPRMGDSEGDTWWREVAEEMASVIASPTVTDAAKVISWWHNDWNAVGDSPTKAARRIRSAAARLNANE